MRRYIVINSLKFCYEDMVLIGEDIQIDLKHICISVKEDNGCDYMFIEKGMRQARLYNSTLIPVLCTKYQRQRGFTIVLAG